MIKKIKNKIPHNLLDLLEIIGLCALCLTLIIGIVATFSWRYKAVSTLTENLSGGYVVRQTIAEKYDQESHRSETVYCLTIKNSVYHDYRLIMNPYVVCKEIFVTKQTYDQYVKGDYYSEQGKPTDAESRTP